MNFNSFYKDKNGLISYNQECKGCESTCKQSFRATIIMCPKMKHNKKKKRGK